MSNINHSKPNASPEEVSLPQALEGVFHHVLPADVNEALSRYRDVVSERYGRPMTTVEALQELMKPFSDHTRLLCEAVNSVRKEVEEAILGDSTPA